jgi:CheY-like chemotaxis protein
MRILVIDDSEVARTVMQKELVKYGHKVTLLSSPIGATRVVVREQIDVVVIDLQMPDVRGDRVAQLFRKAGRTERVGVVLVSGFDREELARLGSECGADSIVTKQEINERLQFAVMEAYGARRKVKP